MRFGPLVTTEWLAEALGSQDVVLFDATLYLPNEAKSGHEEYLKAHIPGARFFDIDAFSDPDSSLPHTVPSQGRFARLIGQQGVDNDSRVVVYDQKGLFSAARAWWLFRYFGHDRVAVLDGGLPKWLAEGRELAQGAPADASPRQFRTTLHTSRLRGLGDVLESVEHGDALILDARATNRFEASVPEIWPGIEAGHIPTSRNLPFTALLWEDHTLRSPEELRKLFGDVGADGSRPVVTSCGSGITASVLLLALSVAELPEGALYDGSWTEWGARPDTPKASGAQ